MLGIVPTILRSAWAFVDCWIERLRKGCGGKHRVVGSKAYHASTTPRPFVSGTGAVERDSLPHRK